MAVFDPSAKPGTMEAAPKPDTDACFRCGLPLTKDTPCVVWWGHAPQNLNLHPDCAKDLALHLAKDGINAANLAANLARRAGGG